MSKPFAIVTGASSGIGLELGAICAQEGFDLLVAADRPEIQTAADRFRSLGAEVTVVETDLATTDGVDNSGPLQPAGRSTRCSPTPGTGWDTGFWIRTSRTRGTSSTRTSPGRSIWFNSSAGRCAAVARAAFS